MTLLILAKASCSLLAWALCFHLFCMFSEPLAFEDMEICDVGLKLYFQ
jgi:hypothetical protein